MPNKVLKEKKDKTKAYKNIILTKIKIIIIVKSHIKSLFLLK